MMLPTLLTKAEMERCCTQEIVQKKFRDAKQDFCGDAHAYVIECLLQAAKQNPELKMAMLQEPKTYSNAFEYVKEQARKKLTNGSCVMDDAEVVSLMKKYFLMGEDELKKSESKPIQINHKEITPLKQKAKGSTRGRKKKEPEKVATDVELGGISFAEETETGQMSFGF